jgi:hypothetical protein
VKRIFCDSHWAPEPEKACTKMTGLRSMLWAVLPAGAAYSHHTTSSNPNSRSDQSRPLASPNRIASARPLIVTLPGMFQIDAVSWALPVAASEKTPRRPDGPGRARGRT